MRRRLFASIIGCLLALSIAGPAFADTVPGPGNFRDSGSSTFLNSFGSVCGQTTCTDTYAYGSNTDLQGGDSFAYVCVEQYTYPLRGGGRFQSLWGCADGVGPDVAADLSAGSIEATILADSCGRRTCTTVEVSLSVSLTAFSSPNAYSYTQKNQYENCTDTYRVRGEAADAEGTILVNGAAIDGFGNVGSETFAFSTRCR